MQSKRLANILSKYFPYGLAVRNLWETGSTFLIIVVGTGLGMLVRSVLARQMDTEGFGYYAYALSWEIVLMQLAAFGLQTSTLRIIPRYFVHGEWNLLRGFLNTSYLVILAISSLIAITVFIFVLVQRLVLAPEFVSVLYFACILIPLDTFLTLFSRQILALKHVVPAIFPTSIIRTLVQIGVIILAYFLLGQPLQASMIMFAYLVGTAAAALITGLFLRKLIFPKVQNAKPDYELRPWIRTTAPLYGQTILILISAQFDLLSLGLFAGITQAGIYSMVILLSTTISFGNIAVNQVLVARFSEAFAAGNMSELQRLTTFGSALATAYALVCFVIILVGGRLFLSLLGKEFVAGYVPLLIVAVGMVANAGTGSIGFLMNMTKLERGQLTLLTVSAMLSLILNVLLTPKWGMYGAASANALSSIVLQIISAWYVWRHLKIKSTVVQLIF